MRLYVIFMICQKVTYRFINFLNFIKNVRMVKLNSPKMEIRNLSFFFKKLFKVDVTKKLGFRSGEFAIKKW